MKAITFEETSHCRAFETIVGWVTHIIRVISV